MQCVAGDESSGWGTLELVGALAPELLEELSNVCVVSVGVPLTPFRFSHHRGTVLQLHASTGTGRR